MKISNHSAIVFALAYTSFSALQASTDLIPTGFISAANSVVVKGEQATLTWNINYPDDSKIGSDLITKEDLIIEVTAIGSGMRYDCDAKDLKTLGYMKLGTTGNFIEVLNNYLVANQKFPAYPITPVNLGLKFGATYNNNIVPKFTKLGFGGQYRISSQSGSTPANWSEKRTTEGASKYAKTLFLGDTVPPELLAAIKANNLKNYLVPYIDKTSGKIMGINSTAMIVLMELDYVEGDTSTANQSLKDFQDFAILVHFLSIPK